MFKQFNAPVYRKSFAVSPIGMQFFDLK